MADILDYHLQHYLRRFIGRLPKQQQDELKTLRLCGKSIRRNRDAIYLLASDNGHSRFYGHTTCKNPFACPVCSAKMMEHYRSRIATAIAILHADYFGFMGSFTIPHLHFMSCRETMDILRDTWTYFRMTFKRKHGHIFHEWKKATNLAHHVKVMEHTWSKYAGWHPHYHMLFWVPRGKEQEAGKWEEQLNEFWLDIAKRKTLQYWQKRNLHSFLLDKGGTYEAVLDRMFKANGSQKGIHFSRDEAGNLREIDSSDYLCGWGADSELTGNVRKEASHKGHMTPYQVLNAAKTDPYMEKIYIDFCLATRTVHRVDFSQTGLVKMIVAYQKEHGKQSEILQKKRQEDGAPIQWRIVAYFDKLQWYELCCLDRNAPVFENILFLAKNHIYLLGDYLSSLNIYPEKVPHDFDEVCELFKCG